MGSPVCRKEDVTNGFCLICRKPVSGKIATASENIMVNGRGVARDTDTVRADCSHEGKIKATSTKTKANGKFVAKVNDPFIGDYFGILGNGSPNTKTG